MTRRDDDRDRRYECPPATPADVFYIAVGAGLLLVLAALALGVGGAL